MPSALVTRVGFWPRVIVSFVSTHFVTSVCNARCAHCFYPINAGKNEADEHAKEYSLKFPVILDPDRYIPGLCDSKMITALERERLYDVITRKALAW